MVTTFIRSISTPDIHTHTHTLPHNHILVYLQETTSTVGYGEDCKNVGFERILREHLIQPPHFIKEETGSEKGLNLLEAVCSRAGVTRSSFPVVCSPFWT